MDLATRQPTPAPVSVLLVAEAPPCAACEALAAVRGEGHPLFVAELRGGVLLLHPDQRHAGHVVLLAKSHVPDVLGLAPAEREQHLADLGLVMQAVQGAVGPLKLNLAAGLDGHADDHLLWHVVPRHADDPAPALPFWQPGDTACPDEAARTDLKRRLLRGLLAAAPVRRHSDPPRGVR